MIHIKNTMKKNPGIKDLKEIIKIAKKDYHLVKDDVNKQAKALTMKKKKGKKGTKGKAKKHNKTRGKGKGKGKK